MTEPMFDIKKATRHRGQLYLSGNELYIFKGRVYQVAKPLGKGDYGIAVLDVRNYAASVIVLLDSEGNTLAQYTRAHVLKKLGHKKGSGSEDYGRSWRVNEHLDWTWN